MNVNENGFLTLESHIKLKPYIARNPIKYEIMTDEEIINEIGGCLVVDTESYKNYFLIAFKNVVTNKIILFEITDDLELNFNAKKLSWIMHNYRTVGFNSINYDKPMIWYSYSTPDCMWLKKLSNELIFNDLYFKEAQQKYSFSIYLTNHIDLIEVC